MAMLDALIDDMAQRFGLGESARRLVREALVLIIGSQGGISGFLNTLRSAGLASEVASWLGHADATPLTAHETERVLGPGVLGRIAKRLDLTQASVSTALGYAMPRLIGLLSPNGVVPTSPPAEVTNFLSGEGATARVAPKRIDVYETPDAKVPETSWLPSWLWPMLGILILLGLGWYFWPMLHREKAEVPVAHAPATPPAPVAITAPAPTVAPAAPPVPAATTKPVPAAITPPDSKEGPVATPAPVVTAAPPPAAAPAPVATPVPAATGPGATSTPVATPAPIATTPTPTPTATLPATLTLENESGVVHFSGALHDEQARASVIDALNTVFGPDKIKGDISVDANRADPPWLANFRAAVDSLKILGVQVTFEGGSVNVGGAIVDADREKIVASLKDALGGAITVGAPADKTANPTSGANAKADSELATLKTGFGAKDVAAALNDANINFPSGGAKIPISIASFLERAAADLKQLPAGSVLEIAGYTDNTGDANANLALSQKRAESVRNLLIKAGVNPDMLIAKGYGSANPIANNDTTEGRFRNRRIEYHVVKAPS